MKKGTLLLGLAVGLGVVALAGRAIYLGPPWLRRTPPPPAPAQALVAVPATAAPSAARSPLQAWHRALGGEVLVFTRGTDTGRPLAGVEVRILERNGGHLRSGRADDRGVYRGTLPAEAGGIRVQAPTGALVFAVAPKGDSVFPPPRPMLADRPFLRPGDRLRVCLRMTPDLAGAVPVATLRFEPAEEAVEPVPFLPVAAGGARFPFGLGRLRGPGARRRPARDGRRRLRGGPAGNPAPSAVRLPAGRRRRGRIPRHAARPAGGRPLPRVP